MKLTALFLLSALSAEAAPVQRLPIDYDTARLERVLHAVRISEGIDLNGRMDEAAWGLAQPATDFVAQSPRPDEPAQEKTEVRVLYDDNNLYIGVHAFYSNLKDIVVNEIIEDFNFGQSDIVSIALDTLHDRSSGFTFTVNPAGARRDMQVSNDGAGSNPDWDGVWDVKTAGAEDGWTAEFQIPFTTLRFTTAATQEWGLNITRGVRALNEESHWSPIPVRFRPSRVSLAGTLRGIENISQGMNLRIKPFVLAGVAQARVNNQMETVQSLTRLKDYDFGLDAKYSLTPSLTLDATYKTDFAQVEADQQQVNLTRFSVFFPEKRDFFLENSGTFNFGPGGNLLPFFSRRIGLSAAGAPVPITGGARVSGQVAHFDVGFLGMKTARLNAVDPNNYFVGRVKRNLMPNAWVGMIVTSRDSSRAGDYNRVYGGDAHFQFWNRLEVDSYLLGSETPGKVGNNQARRFQTAWRDDELVINVERNTVQTNFNPEIGFIRRRDMSQSLGEVTWRPQLNDHPKIRDFFATAKVDYYEGANGKIETREHETAFGVDFKNNARADFRISNTFDRLVSPTRIQGIELQAGDYQYRDYQISVNSNPATKLIGNAAINWGKFWNGRRTSLNGSVGFKPNYHINVNLNYNHNRIELSNTQTVSNLMGARFAYGFTPRAFLNAFFQYNSETREVSSNIRFNLTYSPLSDIYIVYNDRRNTMTDLPMERALIVKVTRLVTF